MANSGADQGQVILTRLEMAVKERESAYDRVKEANTCRRDSFRTIIETTRKSVAIISPAWESYFDTMHRLPDLERDLINAENYLLRLELEWPPGENGETGAGARSFCAYPVIAERFLRYETHLLAERDMRDKFETSSNEARHKVVYARRKSKKRPTENNLKEYRERSKQYEEEQAKSHQMMRELSILTSWVQVELLEAQRGEVKIDTDDYL